MSSIGPGDDPPKPPPILGEPFPQAPQAPPAPSSIDWPALRAAATAVARRAYAPYSGLRVGAAGLTSDGAIVVGCNVENASFGLTLCAECGLVAALHAAGPADRGPADPADPRTRGPRGPRGPRGASGAASRGRGRGRR